MLLPTGPGESRPLPVGSFDCWYASWLRDGKRVVIVGKEPGQVARLFIQDLEGRERRPLTREEFSVASGGLYYGSRRSRASASPDGKLIAALDAQGNFMLFPVEGGDPRPVRAIKPHEVVAGWGADSQSLYVYPFEGVLPVRIDTIDLRSGRRELFKEITPPDPAAFGGIESVVVTPGGNTYAYSYGQYLCNLYLIEGLR
jgi:hypothetical protein